MVAARQPALSVIMPVYNCERFVAEALDSIMKQTFEDFECIVLDDGSTDNTLAICKKAAGDDNRIRLIAKSNTGLVDTLNYGLFQAQAPVIARMDGDDFSYPHRFEVQMEMLELSRCVAISAGYIHIDDFGNELDRQVPVDIRRADAERVPPREPYLSHPFMMFRRDAVLSIGGYRHCLHSEDADLCWRLYDWAPLWNVPETLGRYRLHSGSVSSKTSENARVQAVSAQLAVICYRRSREKTAPIRFELTRAEIMPRAGSFASLIELYRDQLDSEEVERLALGAGIRFLDFSRFRGYPATIDDIAFTRRAMQRGSRLLGDDREWATWVLEEAWKHLQL